MAFIMTPPSSYVDTLPIKAANGVPNNNIRELINQKIAEQQSTGWAEEPEFRIVSKPPEAKAERRRYLGGSQIGGDCSRARWYSVHWASRPEKFEPRVLRLFERGHLEEFRFVKWLRMIGCEVDEHDPDTVPILWHHLESDDYFCTLPQDNHPGDGVEDVSGTYHEWIARSRGVHIPQPRQFSWFDLDGHYKGNSDGRARNVPGVERFGLSAASWILLEFKTHNDKSFQTLANSCVYQAKPEHHHQMQAYMNNLDLPLALYGAVNKNNDDLYFEFVPREHGAAELHRSRAHEAVYSEKPPARVSNSPSWFGCKWCGERQICHYGAPMDKNCRTCVHSHPVANGDWRCRKWNANIPHNVEEEGCDAWVMRTD